MKKRDTGKIDVAKTNIGLNDQEHLNNFPYRIGDWQGIDDNNAEPLLRKLKADTLLMRTYRIDMSGRPFFFLIVHADSTSSIHPPPVCYRVQGYTIQESSGDTIPIGDWALRNRIHGQDLDTINGASQETMLKLLAKKLNIPIYEVEIPVSRLLAFKTNENGTAERRLVYYLYLKDLEFDIRPEFSMLRVSTLVPADNYGDIESELKDFMSEVFTLIFTMYGEERETVISHIAGLGLWGYVIIMALFSVPLAMIIYPLATRKLFRTELQEPPGQETEIIMNTPDQSEDLIDGYNNTRAVIQPLNLPYDLAERTGNDKILGAYYNSQWIIEKVTDVTTASCSTLRDFLDKVTTILPTGTAESFTELTKITERAIYYATEQDKEMVNRACQLAEEIKDQLHGRL
ncbi:exosortase-associated EpsI family protein [Chloroflexota bacterium]